MADKFGVNTGNWDDDSTVWDDESGGVGGDAHPSSTSDDAFIDSASGAITITQNVAVNINSIDVASDASSSFVFNRDPGGTSPDLETQADCHIR